MKFLRNFLAAILGCLVAFGIIFVMFSLFINLLSSGEDTVVVMKNSVLELQLQSPIKDYVGNSNDNPFGVIRDESLDLDELLNAIKVAKDDDDIKGISINNSYMMSGLAQVQELRRVLEDFKTSNKFIYTYGDFYMQKDYYLASVADSIFLNPVGILDFKGLSSEVLFFKDLQEKTGIKMEVIRHGKYKSAVEPFLANEMSDANRKQIEELLESLWSAMVEEISNSRNISGENLNAIADTLGGRTPKMAKNTGLIDAVTFYDEYENSLRNALAISKDEDLNVIDISDYIMRSNAKRKKSDEQKIAVIYAQGEILYGEGGVDYIGQGIINKSIRKAVDDEKIKAIVLRVDSPGGSALVSDIIWREIELAKAVKPVVVSMGNVAASGGYYIAAGADKIFAEPTTITGSIGVFGTIPNLAELAGTIGINAEQVGTNKNAVDYSLFEPLTPEFKAVVQEGIEEVYDTFLSRVSEGRGITIAEADSLAQGRVWSGIDAEKIGLVDALGNLDDAIAEAAKMAEIDEFAIKKFPKYKSGIEKLMEDLGGIRMETKNSLIEDEIGVEAYSILKEIKSTMEQKGAQARMPFVLNIK